jgi:general secretion pathway protein H
MKKNGFSLLEMIIVISIIGAVTAIALPGLLDKKSNTRKVFREFVVAGKDIRNRAKLAGVTYRLAFRLTENKQAWWVEKANKNVLLDKKKLEDARNEAKSTFRQKDDDKPVSEFQPDTTIFKKEQTLPKGFFFKQIESGPQDLIATDGTAYIHFFPQGYIEPSAIQIIDDRKNIWTLVFNPITGQSDIIPDAKTLKDLNR